jgi:phosphoglycolate phosphatase-like HAD superfamily hydrolase
MDYLGDNQHVPDPRPIAVLDIDGVLADVRHRLHHLESRPKDWAGFFGDATRDPLLAEGAAVAATLAEEHELVYLTGRPERCRRDTLAWLRRHALPDGVLLMRQENDRRPARQTKLGHLRRLARRAEVAMVVDDDPDVVQAVSTAGWPTLLADWVPRGEVLSRAQEAEGRT